jgi:DNA-binding NtrC family response regulator
MRALYDSISRLARSDVPVLIVGETGSGKEVVARAIHHFSARAARPFVVVDCGALAPTLVDSELFGHTKGAYTGATANRQGLFEAADGGTLFLDEVCDLPRALQPRLLRVLQEHQVRPLGSTRAVEAPARFICASNRELEQPLKEGRLRRDLYFRLIGATIRVPALRERKEDIPQLTEYFLGRWSEATGKTLRLSEAAMSCLLAHDWPGNVRELERCVEATGALSSHSVVGVLDLPESLRRPTDPLPLPETIRELGLCLREVEERTILRALERAKGNKAVAARLLGIGKSTLYRKLKEMQAA